jgi:hypothetical protein
MSVNAWRLSSVKYVTAWYGSKDRHMRRAMPGSTV